MTLDPCPDCCQCVDCGRVWCRAWEVSPGEAERVCADCWDEAEAVA